MSSAALLSLVTLNGWARQDEPKNENQRVETRVETTKIPAPVQYEMSRLATGGRIELGQRGQEGSVTRTFELIFDANGKLVAKKKVKEERVAPVPTIYYMGQASHAWQPSRGSFVRGRVLTMVATAYTAHPSENGGSNLSRTGQRLRTGFVAVDPRVIPLGSLVYVEGYGMGLACDTGGAIKGNRIDLLMASSSQANAWGRRKVVVHVLKRR
ncbi:MAG: G5 domain-containing protein [Armatimonadetes bacterium]|nr:G5 domain-containing protein [Armatimonadota bacterium]